MDDEIIEALKKIKNVCEEYECRNCPLADIANNCQITENVPELWNLKNEKEIYKFFN